MKRAETIRNCRQLHIFICCFCKLRQPNNILWKFDPFRALILTKMISFNVNSGFEKVCRFEIQNFDYLNCSITRFDKIQKCQIEIEVSVWTIE